MQKKNLFFNRVIQTKLFSQIYFEIIKTASHIKRNKNLHPVKSTFYLNLKIFNVNFNLKCFLKEKIGKPNVY